MTDFDDRRTDSPQAGLTVYGKPDCADFLRSKALLDSLGVPFDWRDVTADEGYAERARELSGGTSTPVMVFDDGTVQVEPTDAALAMKLGFPPPAEADDGEACDVD